MDAPIENYDQEAERVKLKKPVLFSNNIPATCLALSNDPIFDATLNFTGW